MTDYLLIAIAALWAGLINSVVGSGTLVTFPILVWLGFSPLTANISNNLGLVPGALAAFLGTKDQLRQGGRLVRKYLAWSAVGGAVGASLLIALPEKIFAGVVPVFILTGVLLVALAPRIHQRVGRGLPYVALAFLVLIAGMYGGYFGAAQGVILLGLLSGLGALGLHEANALKNALVLIVNGIASVIFFFSNHIDWSVVLTIAVGSTIGATIGSRYGRLLPTTLYRAIIVTVGLISALWFLTR